MARLYRSSHKHAVSWREYRVTYKCKQIGVIMRVRDKKGKHPWMALAFQLNLRDKTQDGFVRRGDAKRWVLQNQTETAR